MHAGQPPTPRRQPAAVPIVEPGIFVVESPTSPGEKGENAWRGYVRDAHDPSARPTVSIRLYRPAVNEQDALLIETRCSSEGVFEFKLDKPAPDGATIEAMAPGYTMERRRLPPPGSLKVHLSTRRRSVITRFTAWARRQIATSGLSEPTPQDVAKRHVGDSNVETWAQDVDHAAFGPTAPNAEVEFELHNRAPGRAPSRAASTIKASKSQIDPQIGGKAPPSTSS